MKRPRRPATRKKAAKTTPVAKAPTSRSAQLEALRKRVYRDEADRRALELRLLAAIKANLPALEDFLKKIGGHWTYEDRVYRFYHQSFKVYRVQQETSRIVEALRGLLPDVPLNELFMQIVAGGTGREFRPEDNARWAEVTRPMLEAFFHAKYFLEMVCRYGAALDEPPQVLPSGWAAVLYLYGLR